MMSIATDEIWKDSEAWLESAAWLGIGMRMSPPAKDSWSTHYHLLMISRAQFAVQLSYARLTDACRTPQALSDIASGYVDLHSFLVSAHLYWRTLRELANDLALPELQAAIQQNTQTIDETKAARDHIEHVTERIEVGRKPNFGTPMDAEAFRLAMGKYESGSVTFGTESFDLQSIHDAIVSIGRTVAPVLNRTISAQFSVSSGPVAEAE